MEHHSFSLECFTNIEPYLFSLDCFTGIGGFDQAAKRNGKIKTIFASEVDPFNCKLIAQNLDLENAGDISNIAITENLHPYNDGSDNVHCEKTGFSALCVEDFFEGVLPFPDIITGGFPCQNVSDANLGDYSGINGEKSSLVLDQLRIIETLEVPIAIFENAEALNRRGLTYILCELSRMGYICEWETISATAFNYPHYRHRLYLVAYLPHTQLAKKGIRVFDHVRQVALYNLEKPFKFPLLTEDRKYTIKHAVVEDTRAIKLRTKRINGLGNAIIPDIAEAIFNSITAHELKSYNQFDFSCKNKSAVMFETEEPVFIKVTELPDDKQVVMPQRGVLCDGVIYSNNRRCELLNPTKTAYSGLFSTLIRKDGNNNFTTKSRLNRPGKLGGLVAEIMSLGVDKGGLNPEFCEAFMGFESGYTDLSQ